MMANCPEVPIALQRDLAGRRGGDAGDLPAPPRGAAPHPRRLGRAPSSSRRPSSPTRARGGRRTSRSISTRSPTAGELEADPSPIVDRARRRPRRAALHRRHDRARQGRHALAREPVARRQGRRRRRPRPRDRPRRSRRCRCRTRSGCWSPSSGCTRRSRGVSVLLRWFDPAAWLALVAGAPRPDQRGRAVDAAAAARPAARGATTCPRCGTSVCGAAPLPPDASHEFERRVPACEILEGYGCTETSALVSAQPAGARRPGSVGLPVPGCDVRILDDDGASCRPARTARSASAARRDDGLLARAGATADAMRDGWFHTGDVGRLDDDGYLYIVDRMKDLIIRGGFNVYPRDVEDALLEHPAVARAAVVGRPDERPARRSSRSCRCAPARGDGGGAGRVREASGRRLQVPARGPRSSTRSR